MKTPEMLILFILVIMLIAMICYYAKCKQKFVKILFGFCSGVFLLYPAQLALGAFGFHISINIFTVCVSAILGIPGVVLLSAISILC